MWKICVECHRLLDLWSDATRGYANLAVKLVSRTGEVNVAERRRLFADIETARLKHVEARQIYRAHKDSHDAANS